MAGNGRVTLLEVVKRPFWSVGSCRKAWTGSGLGEIERPFRRAGRVGRPSRKSGSDQEANSDDREVLPDSQERLGGPPRGPGVFESL